MDILKTGGGGEGREVSEEGKDRERQDKGNRRKKVEAMDI